MGCGQSGFLWFPVPDGKKKGSDARKQKKSGTQKKKNVGRYGRVVGYQAICSR